MTTSKVLKEKILQDVTECYKDTIVQEYMYAIEHKLDSPTTLDIVLNTKTQSVYYDTELFSRESEQILYQDINLEKGYEIWNTIDLNRYKDLLAESFDMNETYQSIEWFDETGIPKLQLLSEFKGDYKTLPQPLLDELKLRIYSDVAIDYFKEHELPIIEPNIKL